MNENKSNNYLAALSYFPFIGWIYPYFINKNEFIYKNARSGLVLSIIAIILTTLFGFLKIFIMSVSSYSAFIITIIIYTFYVAYFVISAIAFYRAYQGKNVNIPIISRIAENINI